MNQTQRDCDQCAANTNSGARCLNRTCKIADLCWLHLKTQKGFAVKPSSVAGAGQGLYTLKEIKVSRAEKARGKPIMKYGGEELTRAQLDARYPDIDTQYVLKINNNKYLDGRSTQSGLGRYVNSCQNTGQRCNAKYNTAGTLVAKKTIAPGKELLASYGAGFNFA